MVLPFNAVSLSKLLLRKLLNVVTSLVLVICRESIAAQLQLAIAKADSEQLARSIAEEQLSDVEKEKTMKELELKEAMARHKAEMGKKDLSIIGVGSSQLGKESALCASEFPDFR